MKLWKIALYVVASVAFVSCGSYYSPTKTDTFVKVYGINQNGDTILIDVNSLRPKIYYNYYYRNDYRPYYNSLYNPPVIIRPPSNNQSNRPTTPRPIVPITKPNKNK